MRHDTHLHRMIACELGYGRNERAEERPASVFRGLLHAVPMALAMWLAILWLAMALALSQVA
jgi:hypothetical protein